MQNYQRWKAKFWTTFLSSRKLSSIKFLNLDDHFQWYEKTLGYFLLILSRINVNLHLKQIHISKTCLPWIYLYLDEILKMMKDNYNLQGVLVMERKTGPEYLKVFRFEFITWCLMFDVKMYYVRSQIEIMLKSLLHAVSFRIHNVRMLDVRCQNVLRGQVE